MTKEQIIERARYNGIKAAENDFNRDYRTAKTYSDSTKELARTYPDYHAEIYEHHQERYINFKQTHRH